GLFFLSSRRRHTRSTRDWSSDVCSSDLMMEIGQQELPGGFAYADDTLFMSMQGATQWDALSHAFYDGVMWNGHIVRDSLDEHGRSEERRVGKEWRAGGAPARGAKKGATM